MYNHVFTAHFFLYIKGLLGSLFYNGVTKYIASTPTHPARPRIPSAGKRPHALISLTSGKQPLALPCAKSVCAAHSSSHCNLSNYVALSKLGCEEPSAGNSLPWGK